MAGLLDYLPEEQPKTTTNSLLDFVNSPLLTGLLGAAASAIGAATKRSYNPADIENPFAAGLRGLGQGLAAGQKAQIDRQKLANDKEEAAQNRLWRTAQMANLQSQIDERTSNAALWKGVQDGTVKLDPITAQRLGLNATATDMLQQQRRDQENPPLAGATASPPATPAATTAPHPNPAIASNTPAATTGSAITPAGTSEESNRWLAKSESGKLGYTAVNKDTGAVGKYQFMPSTLRGMGITDIEGFKNNPQLQEEAFSKFTQQNIAAGKRAGVLTDRSTQAEVDAFARAAHLGGAGGAIKFLKSGGEYNPSDANKTHLSRYYNALPVTQATTPAATAASTPAATPASTPATGPGQFERTLGPKLSVQEFAQKYPGSRADDYKKYETDYEKARVEAQQKDVSAGINAETAATTRSNQLEDQAAAEQRKKDAEKREAEAKAAEARNKRNVETFERQKTLATTAQADNVKIDNILSNVSNLPSGITRMALENPYIGAISETTGVLADKKKALDDLDQYANQLALNARDKLKGSGAISNFEQSILQKAASYDQGWTVEKKVSHIKEMQKLNNQAIQLYTTMDEKRKADPNAALDDLVTPASVTAPPPATSGDLPKPANKAEFDKLPSGATFIDPNGVVRKKP